MGGSAPVANPDGVRPPQVIVAPAPTAEDYFGSDVALDGDTLVVGANEWSLSYDRPGHAYVYTRQSDGTWAHEATLEATDAAGGDLFGCSVAIEGDTIAVGAKEHTAGGVGQRGAVYVFTREGTTWTPRAQLITTEAVSAGLGLSVDISGDTIVAGEDYTSVPATMFAGAATVFRGAGASWTAEGRLFAPDPQKDSCFGGAVAIDGDTVVVGADQQDTYVEGSPQSHGTAYVYERTGSAWSLQQQLHDPTYPAYARAGWAVDVEGDRAYVGVPAFSGTRGHVAVYSRSGGVWSHEATLADPEPFSDGRTCYLGMGVAVDDGLVLAGDPADYSPTTRDSGAVHSFAAHGDEWLYFGKSRSVPPSEGAGWGERVALSDGYGAVGWMGYSLGEYTYEGAALVWDSLPPPRTSEEVTLTLPAPGVLRNDEDAEDDALTASVVTPPSHGTLALSADGSFVYVPEKDFFGEDSFAYRAHDGSQYSEPATCTITVANVNDPPVGAEDTYTASGGLTVDAPGPLANDIDADGDATSMMVMLEPDHGTLDWDSDGSFTYEPAPGFIGTDYFHYLPYDADSFATATVRVSITVTEPPGIEYRELAGGSRYGTALQISRATFATGSCDSVIVATGHNFPDALGAGALAGVLDCPVLLVYGKGASMPGDLKAEIQRLTSAHATYTVYVMGGELAVSKAIENSIRAQLSGETVARVAGGTRYDTAIDCARRVRDIAGTPRTDAFLVTGREFADALLAGPVAFAHERPILLTDNSAGVNDKVKAALTYLGTSDVAVVGSAATVTAGTVSAIDSHVPGACTRVAGAANAFQQSVAVADWACDAGLLGWAEIGVATGEAYPDALGAGTCLGTLRGPLLLTHKRTLDVPVSSTLSAHKGSVRRVTYFGGTLAVYQAVRDAVVAALE